MRAMPVRLNLIIRKTVAVLITFREGGKRVNARRRDLHVRFASV